MSTRDKIKQKCKQVETLLLEKNHAYGDSALIPANVFSHLSSVEAIKIRIDDKLKRIENKGINDETEDTVIDLAGYLILLMIAKDNESNNIQGRKVHQSTTSHTAGNCALSYPTGEEQGSDT
tara:strand:+ start:1148 stop:1513 length:366 start_codon:yes stop_codon:yes gene_type:complete